MKIRGTIIFFMAFLLILCVYETDAAISSVTLISPTTSTYDTDGNITFQCNATPSASMNVSNISVSVWYASNGSLYNTTNYSVNRNSTVQFNITFNNTPEIAGYGYKWNCMAGDNSTGTNWSASNYTFGVDITNPSVTLISPGNDTTTSETTFMYKVTDSNNITNCSLFFNGTYDALDSSVINNTNETIFQQPPAGSNIWSVSCIDVTGRTGNSSNYTIYYKAAATDSGNSGGGGGGGSSTSIGIITTSGETVENLDEGDEITFEVSSDEHTIEVDDVYATRATITISSTPITTTIYTGRTKNFDLNEDGIYDISVTLVSINSDGTIDLTVKQYQKTTTTPVSTPTQEVPQQSPIGEITGNDIAPEPVPVKEVNYTWLWIVGIVVVAVVVYLLVPKKKRK